MKKFYMDVAFNAASMSRAKRLQVGAVVVKEGNIISFSWNGTPPGWDNVCEDENYKTKPEVIHAEENALFKLAKGRESADGAFMFCTHAPCIDCAKGIHSSGIKKVYWRNQYRDCYGIEFLEKCGVEIEQF